MFYQAGHKPSLATTYRMQMLILYICGLVFVVLSSWPVMRGVQVETSSLCTSQLSQRLYKHDYAVKSSGLVQGCSFFEQHRGSMTDLFKAKVWQLLSAGDCCRTGSLLTREKEKLRLANLLKFKPAHTC